MDQNDALKVLIEDAVRRVTEPLQAELRALRAELEALKAGTPGAALSLQPAIPAAPEPAQDADASVPLESPTEPLPNAEAVPAERTDFMRFLQRGLEQEEKEYAPKDTPAPEKKRGWNPFKR